MSVMDPRLRAERYGARPRGRRATVVAAVVVGLVGVGWLAWVMSYELRPDAVSELRSFDVTGPHRAVATVVVDRASTDVRATCVLRAYSGDHVAVGDRSFVLGPADPRAAQLELAVRTERRAVQVVSVGCTTPDQSRPR